MTGPTIATDALPPETTLADLASQAFRLHHLIGGLDLINDNTPKTYDDAPPHQRMALDAHIAMIEVLYSQSRALADALEHFAGLRRVDAGGAA